MPWYQRLVLCCVTALIVVAAAVTFGRGNPLGMATRTVDFPASATSGPVTVLCTVEDAELAATARWADGYLTDLSRWLGVAPAPVTIRLFASQGSFQDFGRARLPGFNGGMAFCYFPGDNTIYGRLAKDTALRTHLQHEMFHSLARQRLPNLPLWLNEGTAELCEGLIAGDGRLQLARLQYERLRTAGRQVALKGSVTPDTIASAGPTQFYGRNGDRYYSVAYSSVLLLQRQGRLVDTLRQPGAAIARAEYDAFVTDTAAWDQALVTAFVPRPAGTTPGAGALAAADVLGNR